MIQINVRMVVFLELRPAKSYICKGILELWLNITYTISSYNCFGLKILIWIYLPLLLYALHPTPRLACLFFKLWYFFSTCKSLIIFSLTAALISEVFSFMKVSTRFCHALRLVRYSTRPYSANVENTKNMQPNTHKSIAFMYETWGVNVLDWKWETIWILRAAGNTLDHSQFL